MSSPPSTSLSVMLRSLTSWTLVVLLAGLGFILVGIGLGVVVSPPLPTDKISSAPQSLAGWPVQLVTTARTAARPIGGGSWSVAEDSIGAEQAPDPAVCLGADLAVGRRAESTHRATVRLPQPGTCGDVREALAGMALGHLVHPDLVAEFGTDDRASSAVSYIAEQTPTMVPITRQ